MNFKEIGQIKDSFKRELENETKLIGSAIESDEPAGFQGQEILFGDVPPKLKTSEYLKSAVGWVYGCVTAIADNVTGIKIRLFEIKKSDGTINEVTDHESLRVLSKVNNYVTSFDHIWLTQQYLELTGEAPWFVDRGKSGKGIPQNILLLAPDRLQIKQNKETNSNGSPVAGYIYKQDFGKEIEISTDELILLKYPDPVNQFRGKGTLQAAAMTFDIDQYSEEFNRRFFFNSARPDSILTTEQVLTQRQKIEIRDSVKKLYQGRKNAHKTAVLDSGLDWKPMSISQKDMDFLNQQKFSMTKLFSIFRVPKAIVAVSDDVNLANAKVAEYVFSKYTISPKMKRIVAQLNEFFLPMFNDNRPLFFSFDDPVPSNVELDLKRYDSALAKGYMTVNEVRDEIGLEGIGDSGDKIRIPNNMIDIDFKKLQDNQNKKFGKELQGFIFRSGGGYQKAFLKFADIEKVKSIKNKAIKKIEKVEEKIDKLVYDLVKKVVVTKKAKLNKDDSDFENNKKRFVLFWLKSVGTNEDRFKTISDKIWQQQKITVLSKIQEEKSIAKTLNPKDALLDIDDETKVLIQVYSPLVREIVEQQGNQAALLVGSGRGAFDMATRSVQKYLEKRVFDFSFQINKETNKQVGKTLAEGVQLGESIPKIRKRIEVLFDGMSKVRSERIARSEVVRASNFANNEAYKQSGVVSKVEWLVTDDERLCNICEAMRGVVVELGNKFFDKGDSIEARDGSIHNLNYEDIEHPPLHVSCRCTIIPIIK